MKASVLTLSGSASGMVLELILYELSIQFSGLIPVSIDGMDSLVCELVA